MQNPQTSKDLAKLMLPTLGPARIFMTKVEELNKDGAASVRETTCRPGHTREEQAKFLQLAKTVHRLNQDAVLEGVQNLSLRNSGDI